MGRGWFGVHSGMMYCSMGTFRGINSVVGRLLGLLGSVLALCSGFWKETGDPGQTS
jgi:hypothetical protein